MKITPNHPPNKKNIKYKGKFMMNCPVNGILEKMKNIGAINMMIIQIP